jgi:hypothetical protein
LLRRLHRDDIVRPRRGQAAWRVASLSGRGLRRGRQRDPNALQQLPPAHKLPSQVIVAPRSKPWGTLALGDVLITEGVGRQRSGLMRKHKSTQPEAPPPYRGDGCEPWLRSDRFFLRSSLEQGMSFAAIAGFLCRDEGEIREKAEEMKLTTRGAGRRPTELLPLSSRRRSRLAIRPFVQFQCQVAIAACNLLELRPQRRVLNGFRALGGRSGHSDVSRRFL